MQSVPCCFSDRLQNMLATSPDKNWMRAKCSMEFEYYFYLDKGDASTIICGPLWTVLCEAYLIRIGDSVKFTYNEKLGLFDVQVTDANNAVKKFVQRPRTLASRLCYFYPTHSVVCIFHTFHSSLWSECWEISDRAKYALVKALFDNPYEVNAPQMNAISFAMNKEAMRPLAADEFFEIPQFYVHKIQNEQDLDKLVIILFTDGIFKMISYNVY